MRSDSDIKRDVEDEIRWDPDIHSDDIAVSAAERIRGVKGVTNLIQVKPRVAPSEIKHKIEKAFTRGISRWFDGTEATSRIPCMNRRAILPLLCGATLTLAAGPGFARVGVVVGIAPPAPVVEAVPAPPAAGYVWQPGYWSWNGVQYVWVPGAYVAAPYMGAAWIPGRWIRHGDGWVWAAGHWRR